MESALSHSFVFFCLFLLFLEFLLILRHCSFSFAMNCLFIWRFLRVDFLKIYHVSHFCWLSLAFHFFYEKGFLFIIEYWSILTVAFAGPSYIPWQNFSSLCCYFAICNFRSSFWRGTFCFLFIMLHLKQVTLNGLHKLNYLVSYLMGQIIPQAICTRYGLSVGANFVWLVRILMIICYPIAFPIGKVTFTMDN